MGRIDIEGLRKVFGDGNDGVVAIDDLDVEIRDGEFLVLVGPSGCGKSTTLRCIAGLEAPTGGAIRLDGTDVTGRKPKDRNMAMVFQSYALYPHMTARENMGFGLKMTTDLSTAEIDERVEESAEMMGISKLLDSKPGEMSGGQQQRVALGRAIVRDPEVFLMDEPLSNLDAKLRTQMRTELQSLQSQFGVTTIYVTHDQTEAMTMSDRIAVLDDGELQQVGTPLECYHEPANEFVAGFIGSPSSAAPVVSTVWWRPTRRPRGRLPLVLPDEPLDGRRADRRAARDGTARSLPRGPPVRRRGRAALRDVRAERITVPGIREPDGSESRGAVRLGSRTGPATTTRSTAAA